MHRMLFVILLLFLAGLAGCSEWESAEDFKTALSGLNVEFSNADSTLFLFVSVNECKPCKEELNYWNNHNSDMELILIVSERYKSNFESYVSLNEININTYQDSSNLFRKRELIPLVPYKVLMTKEKILKLGEMGYNRLPH